MARGNGNKKFKLKYYQNLAKTVASESTELRHKSTQYSSSQLGQNQTLEPEIMPPSASVESDDYNDGEDPAYLSHLDEVSIEPVGRKRTPGDDPMKSWLPECDVFLEEILTLEGRGPIVFDHCPMCHEKIMLDTRLFECFDCCGRLLLCTQCIVSTHQSNPFHRIREWNGHFFVKTTLKSLGLTIQLGHPRGTACANSISSPGDDFVIIDTNGIHEVTLYFCGCGQSNQLHTVQLLRHRLYPATTQNPKTAITFRALETFEMLSYASKVSCFEFYQSLSRLTDNTGTHHVKRKHVSSDSRDPDLGQGFAYFVEEKAYKEYLKKHENFVEPKSNCSRHDAVNLSNAKPGVSHAASGVGTIECARHNMKCPNAVGDLQFGERSLFKLHLSTIYLSYDIACQWSIYLKICMLELDHKFLIFDDKVYVKFVVPKFHLPAHVARCRSNFSLNYTVGAGRTDGEAPERGWAEVNPLASSTKEMGPGSRRDCLDAHFGDYNWRKVMSMGPTLFRKARAAANNMANHTIAHDELTATLPTDTVKKWTEEVEAWERWRGPLSENMSEEPENPYDHQVELPTQAAMRRRLAEAEANDIASGKDLALDVNITPSVLISTGLDLKAKQRSIKVELSKIWAHSQDRQHTRLQLRNNALSRKLSAWSQRQQLYIPAVVSLRRIDTATVNAHSTPPPVHEYPLWLLSSIQNKIPFDKGLAEIEWELRVAQAEEALEDIRHNLQIRSYLFKFKDQNVRGQHANTRARHAIDNVQSKIDAFAEEYRAAQHAIVSLGTLLEKIGWRQKYPTLERDDIREISEAEEGISAGRSLTSWIWCIKGTAEP
ncbi:hypothetical protein C0992_005568, partial [Termitomyces sp. T32_za158]